MSASLTLAASWSLYYLLRDEAGVTAVREELARLSEERRRTLDASTLSSLCMLDSTIREALRLASGSLTIREVLEPCTLETRDGTWAPRKSDRVCLAPFMTHLDPETVPDFDWSRAGLGIYPPVVDVQVRVRAKAGTP